MYSSRLTISQGDLDTPTVVPHPGCYWLTCILLIYLLFGGGFMVQAAQGMPPTDWYIPNHGDGNNDGIPDVQQPNVASLPNKVTGQYITLELEKDCPIGNIYTDLAETLADYDKKYSFPQGLLYFEAHCSHTRVSLYFHGLHSLDHHSALQKYGPTIPGDTNTIGWYHFPKATFDTVMIDGQPVVRASYTLTDGEWGDDTGVDGLIVDPVANSVSTDVDNVISFLTKSYTASIQQGTATVTVTRTGTQGALTIDYATTDDTAINGQDYQATNGTVSWADGERGDKTLTINLLGSATVGRAFTVTLNNLTGGNNSNLGVNIATVTLTNDAVSTPGGGTTTPAVVNFISFTTNSFRAFKNDGAVTVTVHRNGNPGAVSVNYATSDQTALANSDYQPATGTLSWTDGELGDKTVTINLLSSATVGRNFGITLSNLTPASAASWGINQATVTIADNNTVPISGSGLETNNLVSLATKNLSASRQAGVAMFLVNRNGTQGSVTIDYATHDDSAWGGRDYLATQGTLTWADGERGDKTVPVTLVNTASVGTTFTMQLSNLLVNGQTDTKAGLGIPSTALLITDEAVPVVVPPPVTSNTDSLVAFVAKGYTLFKKDNTATLKVSRSGSTVGTLTIDYATQDGTAMAGQDYQPTRGTLSWANGEGGEKSMTVTALATATAGNSLVVKLSNLTGAAGKITSDTAVLTILDNAVGGVTAPGTTGGVTAPGTTGGVVTPGTGTSSGTIPITGEGTSILLPSNDGLGAITNKTASDTTTSSTATSSTSTVLSTDSRQVYDAGGQALPTRVTETSSISHAVVVTDTENYGLLSNLTVAPGVVLTGGQLTGTIINQGTIKNVEFLGISLSGGTVAGTITNHSPVGGIIHDVTLAPNAILSGGRLGGTITAAADSLIRDVLLEASTTIAGGTLAGNIRGTPHSPATLTHTTFSSGTTLSDVTIVAPVELPNDVATGLGVTLPSKEEIAVNNILAPKQIQNLEANTLSTLPHQAIGELTAKQIQDIPPPAFSGLTTDQAKTLNQEAVASLSSEQIQQIPPVAFSALSAEQVAVIPPVVMGAVSGEQLAEIPPPAFSDVSAEQLATVQKKTLAEMTPAQFFYVPSESLSGLTADNLGGLSPVVINQFTPIEVQALQPAAVKTMPAAEVGTLLTNLDPNKVTIQEAAPLVPPDWQLNPTTGNLIPPAGTLLNFKELAPPAELSPLVVLPPAPSLKSSFGIAGRGEVTAQEGINQTLQLQQQAGALPSLTLSQNQLGVLQVVSETNNQLSFMCPLGSISQAAPNTPPAVTVTDGGFYQVTTPAVRQFTMVPVPKDPENLSQVLEDSNIIVGKRGDVFLEEPTQVRSSDRAREVVIFDPLIEPAPEGLCEDIAGKMVCDFINVPPEQQPGIHEVIDNLPRQKTPPSKKKIIYTDGTAQIVHPTVLSPDTFIKQVQALNKGNKATFQADGTFKLFYQGQRYLVTPNFTVKSRTVQKKEQIKPSVALQKDGHLTYTVMLDVKLPVATGTKQAIARSDAAREVLVFDLLMELAPEDVCEEIAGKLVCDLTNTSDKAKTGTGS